MNAGIAKALESIARQQQYKTWFIRIASHTLPVFWWCAGIFFVAGVSHQVTGLISADKIFVLALVPCLIYLIWVIVSVKPTISEGAIAADKLLGVNSQFISAWEITRNPATQDDAGSLLLQRTEIDLPVWHQRLGNQTYIYFKPSGLVAILPAISGLFLMFLPASSPSPITTLPIQSVAEEHLHNGSESNTRSDENIKKLAELFNGKRQIRNELSDLPPNQKNSADSKRSADSKTLSSRLNPANTEDYPDLVSANSLAPERRESTHKQQNKIVTTPPENNRIGGRSPTNDNAQHRDSTTLKAHDFAQIKHIDIETEMDSNALSYDQNKSGNAFIQSTPEQSTLQAFTKRRTGFISTVDPGTLLSVEQRTMVRRYFTQLDNNDESNE